MFKIRLRLIFRAKSFFNVVVFLPFEVPLCLWRLKIVSLYFEIADDVVIGALVEENALLLHEDFNLAVDLHNNNSASAFKLSVDQSIVNASDVFQFSRASK